MGASRVYAFHFVIPEGYQASSPAKMIRQTEHAAAEPYDSVLQVAADALLASSASVVVEGVYQRGDDPRSVFTFALMRKGVDVNSYRGESDEVGVPYVFYSNPYDFESGILEVHFAPPLFDSHPDATFRDLDEAVGAGYVDGDASEIVIRLVPGRGGDSPPFDLVIWLLDHGVDVGLDVLYTYVGYRFIHPLVNKLRNGRADRQARKIAIDWAEKNLHSPSQLRQWVESKDSWDPTEISQRLRIGKVAAVRLLKALGYEENVLGLWSPGTSSKARRRHDRWLMEEFESPFGPEP